MDDYFEPAPFDWTEEGATQAYTKKRKYTKKKREYVGWGSRELIDFLVSIGKDTTKALSQQDVTAIINQYVHDKNLINPAKKKRVLCDDKLKSLFGRKQSIARNKIYDLLDLHLAGNQTDSDGDQSDSHDENDQDGGPVYKRQRSLTSDKKAPPKKKALEVPKTALAAINAENIKLVFLRKSLVQELLRNPESFERKVVGSFVRVKSDPYDIFQKNSHELHLVTGVTDAQAGDHGSTLLQISRMEDNLKISELSDENFTKEEIEDLHRRVKDGSLKQPTVGELEIKVQVLHEDITKHWLAKELILLKNLIDQANVKGVRYKVLEYSDRRKLLESPVEQSRLFSEIPNVIPEEVKAGPIDEGSPGDSPKPDDSPKAADWDWEPYDVPSTNGISEKPDVLSEPIDQGATEIGTRSNGYAHDRSSPEERNQPGTSFLTAVDNGHAKFTDQKEREAPMNNEVTTKVENNGHNEFLNPNNSDIQKSVNQQESNGNLKPPTLKEPEKAPVVIDLSDDNGNLKPPTLKEPEKAPVVIDLSDDEDEQEQKKPDDESGNTIPVPPSELLAWFYFDPQGRVQGPFSLMSLKRWNDLNYFPPHFKVWIGGQSPEEAVLLSYVLHHIFPK